MMDKQECILPKQKENKKETEKRTQEIERDIGDQDEFKEERGKPELYIIQCFQSQVIIDGLIWLKTIDKEQKERERERGREKAKRKRERNIDVTQARVLVTFSSA